MYSIPKQIPLLVNSTSEASSIIRSPSVPLKSAFYPCKPVSPFLCIEGVVVPVLKQPRCLQRSPKERRRPYHEQIQRAQYYALSPMPRLMPNHEIGCTGVDEYVATQRQSAPGLPMIYTVTFILEAKDGLDAPSQKILRQLPNIQCKSLHTEE